MCQNTALCGNGLKQKLSGAGAGWSGLIPFADALHSLFASTLSQTGPCFYVSAIKSFENANLEENTLPFSSIQNYRQHTVLVWKSL